MTKYSFWATVSRVVVAIAAFFGKEMTEAAAEALAKETVLAALTGSKKTLENISWAVQTLLWGTSAVIGTCFCVIGSAMMPKEVREDWFLMMADFIESTDQETTCVEVEPEVAQATVVELVQVPAEAAQVVVESLPVTDTIVEVTFLEAPEVAPMPEVVEVQAPAEVVPEAAQEGEQAYSRKERESKGKKRVDYRPVVEPVPGEQYWYKRGRTYIPLVHPKRMAA